MKEVQLIKEETQEKPLIMDLEFMEHKFVTEELMRINTPHWRDVFIWLRKEYAKANAPAPEISRIQSNPELIKAWKDICKRMETKDFKQFQAYPTARTFLEDRFHILCTGC
jgi:hypothetical protein